MVMRKFMPVILLVAVILLSGCSKVVQDEIITDVSLTSIIANYDAYLNKTFVLDGEIRDMSAVIGPLAPGCTVPPTNHGLIFYSKGNEIALDLSDSGIDLSEANEPGSYRVLLGRFTGILKTYDVTCLEESEIVTYPYFEAISFIPATPENQIRKCIIICEKYVGDLSKGPCLSDNNPDWTMRDWVCDVAHDPRQPADDMLENQCDDFKYEQASHFVEVSPNCRMIKVK